jgi:hypothetical protein
MRDAENVTHQYKDTEFSSAERQAVSNAMRAVARLDFVLFKAIIV